jgi:hypothetical protein
VNVKTKEQSKQKMHTHSPNKQKSFKQTLSACQKAGDNWFLGQDRKGVPMEEILQKVITVT